MAYRGERKYTSARQRHGRSKSAANFSVFLHIIAQDMHVKDGICSISRYALRI
jgi:hypothetical protein